MLPLQQAREVRDSVIEYIKATFRFKEKDVSDAFIVLSKIKAMDYSKAHMCL